MLRVSRIIPDDPTIRGTRIIHPREPHPPASPERLALEEHVARRYDELMACVATGHAPEFAALDVTMAQMKALYLVAAHGSLHITALAELLGVTLSTGSGLADRLVDQGLLERRHDELDRRHVVVRLTERGSALLERMRELSSGRVRSMLGDLDDADLSALGRVLASFIRQVTAETADRTIDPTLSPTLAPQQKGAR